MRLPREVYGKCSRTIVSVSLIFVTMVSLTSCDEEEVDGGDLTIQIAAGDVAELYRVVNSPEFAGYRVLLEPGVYALDASIDPDGNGHLMLQEGMALIGRNEYRDIEDLEGAAEPDGIWDPWDVSAAPGQYPNPDTETIIDCSSILPQTHIVTGCGDTPDTQERGLNPVVLVHDSALRNLTVRNYETNFDGMVAWDPGLMGDDLPADGDLSGEVTDCVIESAASRSQALCVGLAPQLQGCRLAGRTGSFVMERNIVRHAGYTGVFAMSNVTENTQFTLTVRHNRFEDNGSGLQAIGGDVADGCEMEALSDQNVYHRNSNAGLSLLGGADAPVPSRNGAHGNLLVWTSDGDVITNNGSADNPYAFGGVSGSGATLHEERELGASGNHLDARFYDVVFARETPPENNLNAWGVSDVTLWGFWGLAHTTVTDLDRNNTVSIEMEGCVGSGYDNGGEDALYTISYRHSDPSDSEGTNTVSFEGGRDGIIDNNVGCFPLPQEY